MTPVRGLLPLDPPGKLNATDSLHPLEVGESWHTPPSLSAPPNIVVPYRFPFTSKVSVSEGPKPSGEPVKLCTIVSVYCARAACAEGENKGHKGQGQNAPKILFHRKSLLFKASVEDRLVPAE